MAQGRSAVEPCLLAVDQHQADLSPKHRHSTMGQTSPFYLCSPASDSHPYQEVIAEHHIGVTGQPPPRASWPQGGRGWVHKASLEGQYGATFTLGKACPSSLALSFGVAGDWFPVLLPGSVLPSPPALSCPGV